MATNTLNQSDNGNRLPENITLRIVILAHGNRAEDDLFLVLNLDTTINQLKQRVQESFSQHPLPENQRLIYHGRPLLDGDMSLRQILRVDQRAGSPSHVIHLVVRDPTATHTPPAVPVANTTQQPLPQHQAPRTMPLGPNAHMALHERLHNMQHQLHHQQALRASQTRPPQHAAPQIGQAQPGQGREAGQPQPNGSTPNAGHPPHMPHVTGSVTRIEERIGPNGERVRTIIDSNGTSSSTTMTFRMAGLNVPNPLDRPLSAPGSSPPANADTANRASDQMPRNIHVHAPVPHVPAGFPLPPGMHLPPPIPSLFTHPLQNIVRPPPAQAMAWLLSSPQGPQGIVFAPGHGFFTTAASQVHTENAPAPVQPTPTTSLPAQPQPTYTATAAQRPHAQLVVRPHDGLAEVMRPDQPAPPQPGAVPQPPQAPPAAPARRPQHPRFDNNDLLQWFISRAWLFMRMYMFIFVFSESGSWRRLILLTSAIIFCLLPDNNPLSDAFNAARRHFDNLIGSPNIPQRPAQPQAQAQIQNPTPGQANNQGTASQSQAATSRSGSRRPQQPMPTPEEAARRLLQQQNRRNPNPVLDFLYRIEQGVALFLASLIPGLGERHVQAREQARRILEEEERRLREEEHSLTEEGQRLRAEGVRLEEEGAELREEGARLRVEENRLRERLDRLEGRTIDGHTTSGTSESKSQASPLPESWSTPGADSAMSNGQASSSGVDRSAARDAGLRSRGPDT